MLRAIPASLALLAAPLLAEPPQLSGIYPHLA